MSYEADTEKWFNETRCVHCPSCGAVRKASDLRSVVRVELKPALLEPAECLEALEAALERYGVKIGPSLQTQLRLVVSVPSSKAKPLET